MEKMIYWSMINPTTDGGYQMAEVSAAEYSAGWNGDTKAYLDNLDVEDMEYSRDESILSCVSQNFGGHNPLPESICIVIFNGKPSEIYWAAYGNE